MSHTRKILAATCRGALVLLLACTLGHAAFANGPVGAAAAKAPVATSVRAVTSGAATLITIEGTAPMPYTVRRPEARTVVVELPGVDGSQLAPSYTVASPLVGGVTVSRALKGSEPVSSVQVTLRAPARERTRLEGSMLVLELQPEESKVASDDAGQQARPTPTPTDPNRATQTSQGAQYGQPGFVGEPINLNVVNADIRDILNYITEQYGVNFVVDASVQRVPVTINVTDVPWNFALDSILKANRLGVEVNGNILRVATLGVLKEESQIRAQEEAARTALRDAQLQNEPLVTEFIRLNYARASGSLSSTAAGADGFVGGGNSGAGAGSGGDSGILPIISRRLSRRGGIEVDSRSNTIIVTDVRANIEAVKRLVELLDQPEPQVEIETRIVVANRSFSRDLGVQLSASVLNPTRGAFGSFETANGINLTNGSNSLAIPSPSGALSASAPNTVIGLTTGIFGTAQISALITAAENRGQAKVVATPRVTALNNRSAQIESGAQIPVVTPQGSSGGASVFTTTFVPVPLRLSITPQITDAGTVILRVTMENNTVNRTLINSLGTPGIDTQRMQTEVLVPDGGTTVVGGVLNDRETDTQNRVPGLAGVPVLGNLFKRKAISRNTDEILFFITPRIYRPDYQGRRVENDPATGPRSVTIPQPVPLGNPSTNTPATAVPAGPQPYQQSPSPVILQPSVVPSVVMPATTTTEAPPASSTNPRP
ncbi:MAG TPA: type IV pilus secretin PilQ [Pyrinomonadaceae bacterium]|nr:type IV pilus secretin PilQ [Pyrinomonadaceae bacterium]